MGADQSTEVNNAGVRHSVVSGGGGGSSTEYSSSSHPRPSNNTDTDYLVSGSRGGRYRSHRSNNVARTAEVVFSSPSKGNGEMGLKTKLRKGESLRKFTASRQPTSDGSRNTGVGDGEEGGGIGGGAGPEGLGRHQYKTTRNTVKLHKPKAPVSSNGSSDI